ncbi:hypothetical protein M758_4G118300 [Ceratodon purpureus]|nr:hypothetical protein M758_4G118300 [Ceratodon purpureus]
MDFEGLEADFAQIQWPLPHHIPAINDDLIADLAQIQWPVPHHIPAINEEYEAERLYPLEGRFMNLPVLHIQDLDLLVRALNLPPPVQDPRQIIQLDLISTRLPEDWPVYEGMNYLGVDEDEEEEEDHEGMDYLGVEDEEEDDHEGMNYLGEDEQEQDHEVWEEPQNMEEEEQDENLEEEIIVTSNAFEQVPVDVSLSTKRRDPISNDLQLLRDIKSSDEPHIPTIGLLELTMPDYASPVFVPTLEPRH